MKPGWTLDDINWDAFDPSKVNPETLQAIKASALVEFNAKDYVAYLDNVFHDDPEFLAVTKKWGREETQHGRALSRWVEMADPGFQFEEAFKRFDEGYSLPLDTDESVRGSRAGELIARCIVESGTTSFYSAVRDSTEEPVLKQITSYIAGDEMRHYKLFYDNYLRVAQTEKLPFYARYKIAIGRIHEADDDDELGFAYYCANTREGETEYVHAYFGGAYERRVKGLYRQQHINRLVSMTAKAIGLNPQSVLVRFANRVAYWIFQRRVSQLAARGV